MNVSLNNNATIKNLHLITSIIFIVPIALCYGVYPKVILSKLFDIEVETINLMNIFRAMMGLYLGISAFWFIGVIKPGFWGTATLINIVFMGSLSLGRLLSLVVDGIPSVYFLAGLLVELLFAFWGVMNINKYRNLIKS